MVVQPPSLDPMDDKHSNKQQQHKQPEQDEEGLLKHYNVILCGTDLVSSILSSALARAGVSVLHLDTSNFYGSLESVHTLHDLLQVLQNDIATTSKKNGADEEKQEPSSTNNDSGTTGTIPFPLHPNGCWQSFQVHSINQPTWPVSSGSHVVTPYGRGVVEDAVRSETNNNAFVKCTIALSAWTLADRSSPKLHLRIPISQPIQNQNGDTNVLAIHPDYLWETHSIRAVQSETWQCVEQQSHKLMLDLTPLLVYAQGSAVDGLLTSSVSDHVEFKTLEGLYFFRNPTHLSHVPCSKKDVFNSPHMTILDKRRLMKFLQTTLDFATASENTVDELHSWNERYLNQGRSLARPQNKQVANTELEHLQQLCENDDSLFQEYLANHVKLSSKMIPLVRYALALETEQLSSSTRRCMESLCRHLRGLGRYGGTAFLVPLYGSGELAQAFCRSGAVFGATYLLRRTPLSVNVEHGRVQSVRVGGCDHENATQNGASAESKDVSCDHVVFSEDARPLSMRPTHRVLRRISVVCGKPIVAEDASTQQRHVVIVPPNTFNNQTSTIHGLLVDEAVNVAPYVPGGCTVVHLTTTVENSDKVDDSVLKHALEAILDQGGARQLGTVIDEIFCVSFSYPLPPSTPTDEGVDGVHVIKRPRPGLSADDAFEQAEAIFSNICPSESFLNIAQKVDAAIREHLGDRAFQEEDEEQEVLDSAVSMIDQSAKPETSDEGPATSTS